MFTLWIKVKFLWFGLIRYGKHAVTLLRMRGFDHVVCHLTRTGNVTPKQFNWNISLIENQPCNVFGVECIICYCCGWVICVFTVSIRRFPRLCLRWYGGLFISVLSDVACFCPVRTGSAGKMKIVEEPNTFGYEALKYIWYCLATALAATYWLIFFLIIQVEQSPSVARKQTTAKSESISGVR